MDDHSRLDGTAPISSMSDRVWRVQKKRRTEDRNRQEGRRNQRRKAEKKEEELQDIIYTADQKNKDETVSHDSETRIGYGSSKLKKRFSKKIDLII